MQKHFWFRQHQSLEEKELADYKAFSCWSQTKYGQGLLEQQQKQVYPHIYRNWQLSQFGSVQYDLCLIGPHASIQLFQPLQAQAAKIGFHWLDVGHEWPIGSEDTNSVFVDRFRAWDNQPSVFQAASYHLPFAEESMQLVVVYRPERARLRLQR